MSSPFRLAVVAVLALSSTSWAARRPFLVGHDPAMVAEGDVEAETWLDEEWNPAPPPGAPTGWLWWAGVYWSPHESFEVRAFTSVIQRDKGNAILWAELLSARWRFLEGGFGALVAQLDLRIPILVTLPWQVAPTLSWSKKLDRFTFTAQAGYAAGFRGEAQRYHWLTWDAGVAIDAVRNDVAPVMQVGVEAFSEVMLTPTSTNDFNNRAGSTVNVGPTISLARGRLWFTVGALFGVTADSPNVFIRGMIGLAL